MKILVTGANGQLGNEFTLLSNLHGYNIVCFDSSDLDITNEYQVSTRLNECMPDVVINCAAYTAVDDAEFNKDSAFSVNSIGPRNLAIACDSINSALIHISTDYVFSGDKHDPYVETDSTSPNNVYGASKLEGELQVQKYLQKHIIIRTSWVFGNSGNNFVKSMLRLSSTRDELSIINDQFGAPTSAVGIAECCMKISNFIMREDINWGVYHFSGYPFCTWYDFAKYIFTSAYDIGLIENLPKLNPVSSIEYHTAATRPQNSTLSCKKITTSFLIQPDDWKRAVSDLLYSMKNQKK